VVLIVALIALVVITLVTVASVRSTTNEEKMAGATRDRNKAFQAAEYALRECLASLQDGSYAASRSPAPLPQPLPPAPPVWEVATNWTSNASREVTVRGYSAYELAAPPRCLYEELGAGTGSYRVTARALGASDTTAVILQATYSTE
jgi:type IV pilus assembly protein PilX